MATVSKTARTAHAAISSTVMGDVTLLRIAGVLDEQFAGFGDVSTSTVVVDLGNITRITSFGVRQWLKAIEALPTADLALYLASCPPYFVDQLNMVKGFAGRGKVVSVLAPYTCTSCHTESDEIIDVVAEREVITKGEVPQRQCRKCGKRLEFDEIVESYFACINKYGATSVTDAAAAVVSQLTSAPSLRSVHIVEAPPDSPTAVRRAAFEPAPRPIVADERDGSGTVLKNVIFAAIAIAIAVAAFLAGRFVR